MNTLFDFITGLEKKEGIAVTHFTGYRHFSYTYNDVFTLARKAATYLSKNGIKKGDAVFLWGPNSPAWIIFFLGCIIRGACAIPLDMRHTTAFVEKIQKQVHAKMLLTTAALPLPKITCKKAYFEDFFYELSLLDLHPLKEPKEEDLVEIVYTSGTTGDPKGVVLTHKNLAANLFALQLLIQPQKKISFLSVLPLSHLFEQMMGFMVPLQLGARMVYPPNLKPSLLAEMIQKEKITAALLVPRLLEALTHYVLERYPLSPLAQKVFFPLNRVLFAPVKRMFSRLQFLVSGGAPLDPQLEKIWENIGIPVLQGYGLTETSPALTYSLPEVHAHGSVGKPLPNVEMKIENGEILVKGDNIFSGYYKNAEKTKESFSHGWFRTGDLGFFDENGFLYIQGRKKDMIKTSAGINVYPEDIETVLKHCKGVKDACVLGLPTNKGEQIYASLLLEKGNPAEIIAEANKHLDESQNIRDYSVWPLPDFPRTPTMKIKKFEVLNALQKEQQKTFVQKSPVNEILAQFTSKKITSQATLQDLGLSSLDRVELASQLEQKLLRDIDENELRPETTVQQVEELLGKKEKPHHIRRWTRWPLVQAIRLFVQHLLFYPLISLFCTIKIKGKENIANVKTPVIFVANHESHFDTPVLLMSVPFSLRTRIAPAAWEEYFFSERKEWWMNIWQVLAYNFTTIFFHVFMFPQTKGFRKALRYAGELIDNNWNLLVFPEGARTTGKMLSFKEGIGFLAKEMKVPIIPVRLHGLSAVLPPNKWWPIPGNVMVTIGKPLSFTTESIVEITKQVEDAVKRL